MRNLKESWQRLRWDEEMTTSLHQVKRKKVSHEITEKNTTHFITVFRLFFRPVSNNKNIKGYFWVDEWIAWLLPAPNGRRAVSLLPDLKLFLVLSQLITDCLLYKIPQLWVFPCLTLYCQSPSKSWGSLADGENGPIVKQWS